jgi:drug/metabolite transporter (DMT)-like permease
LSAAPAGAARGVLLLLASMLVLSLCDACNKALASDYPATQVIWFRYAIFALFALWFAWSRGRLRGFACRRPGLQVVRSLLVAGQNGLVVAALPHLPLATVMALIGASPLIATLLAAPVLKERVGARRWAAVGVAFAGVLVILRPGLEGFNAWALAVLAAAAMFAAYQILTRLVSAADPLETTLVMTATPALLAITLTVPFAWRAPEGSAWLLFLGAGVLAALGHFMMIRALELAPASLLQPFNYSMLLWAALIGFVIFGETPDAPTFAGAALIVASGLYAFRVRAR